VKPRYMYMQNFCNDWCTTDTGVENFAPWWFLSIPPPKSTTPLTVRSCQPCTILWMAATMVIHSVWHSVHRWGSIYLAWYYRLREFTLLGIQTSTRCSRKSFSTQIFSYCVVWCMDHMLSRDV
jgi:hypothetical protein